MTSPNTAIRTFVASIRAELRPAIRSEKDFIEILLSIWIAAGIPRDALGAICSSQEERDEVLAAYSQLEKLKEDGLSMLSLAVETARQLMTEADLEAICPEDWLGESFDEFLAKGSVLLPQEVVELICQLGEMSSGDVVYAPWDVLGQVATWSYRKGAEAVVKTPLRSRLLYVAKLFCRGSFKVVYGDPILNSEQQNATEPSRFNVAIGFPPIGVSYKGARLLGQGGNLMEDVSSSSTGLGVAHLIEQAQRRAVVVVPTSFLSASGADERARAMLLAAGVVQAVIALPNGLFPSTSLQISVLVLAPRGAHDEVRFIDASGADFYQKTSKARKQLVNVKLLAETTLNSGTTGSGIQWCKTASVAEISALQSSLQVGRYVVNTATAHAKSMLQSIPTTTLGNLVSYVSPIPTSALRALGDKPPFVDAQEVGIQDLAPMGFSTTASRQIKLSQEIAWSYNHLTLRPWDIVVITKGSVGRVGLLSPVEFAKSHCFASQSAVALRFNPPNETAAKALYLLLRSQVGNQMLTSIVAGTTTPLIQLRELMKIELPLLDVQSQAEAAALFDREQEIQNQINKLRNEQAALSAGFWTLAGEEQSC